MRHPLVITLAALTVLYASCSSHAADAAPSYSRDVRPILSANCFACHGPDDKARKAKLRLDTREAATRVFDNHAAIVPGEPGKSEIIARLTTTDDDDRMPPAKTGKTLTAAQVDTLRRWIASGANYEEHWAFVPPVRPALPQVSGKTWPRNAIDTIVLAKLDQAGLKPAPQADRYTLVRRVYLDLIGLPPTPEEADAFVNDTDPKAYDNLVDRLLASEHYGERWARLWLDLARYSDTNGYEKDRPRSVWPYRDWVIRALNADMPFDEFTIEQLAGDMLPNATSDQRIATGFHRNTMLNEEGGIDPLEFRFYAMVDRVATTGMVWMGLTTGCAQCHSHKYDPITHTDYYRLMALLNNADEPDLLVPDPVVMQRRQAIETQIAQLEAELPSEFPPSEGDTPVDQRRQANLDAKFGEWVAAQRARAVPWTILRPTAMTTNLPRLELLDDGSIFSTGDITKRDVFTLRFNLDSLGGNAPITALRLEVLPDDRLPAGGPGRAYYEGRQGDFFLSEVTAKVGDKSLHFSGGSQSYGKISIGSGSANASNVYDGDGSTGWSTASGEGEAHQLVLNLAEPLPARGELVIELLFERHFAASLGRFRFAATSASTAQATTLPVDVEAILTRDRATWNENEQKHVLRHYLSVAPELAAANKKIEQLRKQLPDLPTSLVMQERPADNPRPTFRHHRGEYLSTREEVTPGVPAFLPQLRADQPANRLTFARWLVSESNPMVARVTVNRAWRAFFGQAIVRTTADFGTQSSPPTHPELLDWLAREFVDQGWSNKKLHRLIVTSATYRQSSIATADAIARDPDNVMLARGPRFRVDAEMVRDITLRSSGLLTEKVGGPSVYPPQPASVTALAYGNTPWPASGGADRYRRSLYTYSKRTAPFAAYLVFDAPTGEQCVPRRDRSNTPLQALTLLNDEMFLEMSRATARMAMKDGNATDTARATLIFRRFLTRPPTKDELAALTAYQQAQLKRLTSGELNAAVIGADKQTSPELASWMLVARVVMNLDETITRQ